MDLDLVHIGVTLAGVVITVAVVKNDLKWIREWMHEHKEAHRERDADVSTRLRKLELGD
jgi:hypothetical protein